MDANSLIQLVQDNQLATLVVAMFVASGLQLKVTKWVALESGRVKMLVTGVISAATAVIPAAMGYLSANPTALGERTAIFFTGMTVVYRFVILPMSKLLEDAKNYRDNTAEVTVTAKATMPTTDSKLAELE